MRGGAAGDAVRILGGRREAAGDADFDRLRSGRVTPFTDALLFRLRIDEERAPARLRACDCRASGERPNESSRKQMHQP